MLNAANVVRDPVVLREVSWNLYERILTETGEDRSVRLAYSDGALELRPLSPAHEVLKCALADIVLGSAAALGLDALQTGSMTCKRDDLRKGVEPDPSFYLRRSHEVAYQEVIDVASDPPPDLMIEIDLASSSVDKLPIVAAMQVPEVWRWSSDGLRIYILDGPEYQEALTSAQLAPLSGAVVTALMRERPLFSERLREPGEGVDPREPVVDFPCFRISK